MRALLSLALIGCTSHEIVVGGLQEITALKAIPNPDLDILFVVDNSPSMADKQSSLAASFAEMIDVLARLDGGLPNLHLGVVTSDLGTVASDSPEPGPSVGQIGNGGCFGRGDDGALRGGIPAIDGTFIVDVAQPGGGRIRNYTGELRDVFAALARVGEGGCGFEQHLAAVRRALSNPANAGFVRPTANLAVIVIGDEDDCSVRSPALFSGEGGPLGPIHSFRCARFGVACDPDDLTTPGQKSGCAPRANSDVIDDIQPFVDALVSAKGDPRMVMVAAIAGDPTPFVVEYSSPPGGGAAIPQLAPSCVFSGPTSTQRADPAVRLSAFLDAFPGRAHFASICSSDLSGPLAEIGSTAKKLVGDPCLDAPGLADASADPGLQPACEVIDVRDSAPGELTPLPPCAIDAADCYEIVPDAAACPTAPEHLRVQFRRSRAVTDDTWTHVRCQITR